MIASLRGILLERTAGACVIECAGVGYLVQVSAHTAQSLPVPGRELTLRTRQVVREDSVQLFGFSGAEELGLFDMLIGVSGVGPKLALAVLSGLKPPALARAIREEQVGALVAIPGIGRKTAERLIVDLRDKLDALPAAGRDAGVVAGSAEFDDAVAALVRLGYTVTEAKEAIRKAAEGGEELSTEALVRRSLAALGRAKAMAR